MDISSLNRQINMIKDMNGIFLLEALSEISGLFSTEGKFLYVAKDEHGYQHEGIETEYLKLQTHVRISAVKNDQTFRDGYYNIIVFKGNTNDQNFETFIQLCVAHANNADDLSFKEYFYSLISLFQLPADKSFTNAVGLYGELKFMEYVYNHLGLDISSFWHMRGPYSRYDFSNGEQSLEIKTTLYDNNKVTIKHKQVFSAHPCLLVVVICEEYEKGETIEEMVTTLYQNEHAFCNIGFSINLARELKRVSEKDLKNIRFNLINIDIYDASEINPFHVLPDNVSDLRYLLDTSELASINAAQWHQVLKSFMK